MAPLTWRNVDAPSFSGVVDAQRLAAQNFNAGFDNLSKLLEGIGEKRTNADSSKLAFDLQKYNTREEFQAAVDSGALDPNGKSYNQDALNLLSGYRESLQQGELTDTNIAGNKISNDGKVISNQSSQFNLDQGKDLATRQAAQRAAQPAASKLLTDTEAMLRSGDPAQRAKAIQMRTENAELIRSAGMDPVAGITGADSSYQSGVQGQDFINTQEDSATARNRQKVADTFLENLRSAQGPDQAAKMIQQAGLDLPTTDLVMKGLQANQGNMFPAVNPVDAYLDQAAGIDPNKVISYANQNAKRNQPLNNDLANVLASSLGPLGITAKVISGGQATKEEAARGEGTRTNSNTTNHDHGGAGDVDLYASDGRKLSWEKASDVPLLVEASRRIKAAGGGVAAGPGYMSNDGTRMHIGLRPNTWGASSSRDSAYEPLKEIFDGTPGGKTYGSAPVGSTTDGSNSTKPITPEQTITIKDSNGDFVNIPTLIDGQPVSNDEAQNYFEDGQNPAVGRFKTKQEAESAAQARSTEIDAMLNAAANGKTNENTLMPLGGPAQTFGQSQQVTTPNVQSNIPEEVPVDNRSELSVLQQAGKTADALGADASTAIRDIANAAKIDRISNTTANIDEAIAANINNTTDKNKVVADLKSQGGPLANVPEAALIAAIDQIRERTGANYATAGLLAADSIEARDLNTWDRAIPFSCNFMSGGDAFGTDETGRFQPRINVDAAVEKLNGFDKTNSEGGIDIQALQARQARLEAGKALTPSTEQLTALADAALTRLNDIRMAVAAGRATKAELAEAEKQYALQIKQITADIKRVAATGVQSQYGNAAIVKP